MAKPDEILLKLRVAEEGVKTEIASFKKSLKDLDQAAEDYEKTVEQLMIKEQKLKEIRAKVINRNSELSKSYKANTQATGAATAATMELGRVISDAPYGIRGMANNMSQLASNIFFMSKKVDEATGKTLGFMGAMKNLGRSLMGSMGVLVAIQLLIAVFEAQNQVKTSAIDIEKKLREEMSKTLSLMKDISFMNQSRINRSKEIIKLEEDIKDAKKKGDEAEVNRLMKERLKLLITDAEVRKITLEGVIKDSVKGEKANVEATKELFKVNEDLYRLQRELARLDIEKSKRNGKGMSSTSVFNVESFNKESKDLLSATQKLNQEIELEVAETEEEKLNIKHKYRLIELQQAKQAEIQKLNDAKDLYEAKVNSEYEKEEAKYKKLLSQGKITQKQLTDWQIQASQEVLDKLDDADKKKAKSVSNVIKSYDDLIDLYEKLYGIRLNAIGADEDKSMTELEKIGVFIDAYKTLMSGLTQFINGEFERQLTIEQNKTNALNEELNNRLLNENLSKDERAKIQQEIWQNDEELRKKQNEIKKRQFNTQKAFNIVSATIDTYSAATKTLNDPTLGTFARFALTAATIAKGLAQVAMISRQKFQPDAASTPIRTGTGGSGGGGLGDRSFNFNLVGANQQNQLLNAIQSQFDRPLKAYVVSKDITNQQQLDANTRASARFGG